MAVENKKVINGRSLPVFAMILMKNMSFMVVLFIAFLMCMSTYGIIGEGSAKDFLSLLPHIQAAPWKTPVLAFLGLCTLMILINIEKRDTKSVMCCCITELLLAGWLTYIVNFSYTGLILLIFADYMRYIRITKHTYFMLAAAFIIYIIANSDILNGFLELVPLSSYISYYNTYARWLISVTISLCASLNSLLFIVSMIFIIHRQTVENKHMQDMNKRLNDLNRQLKATNIQLEENAKKIANMTKVEERNRLAREIHDTLGHVLTGVVTGIDACNELITVAPEVAKKQLENIANAARQGMTDVRRSVKALRPDVLETLPFAEALEKMISEMVLSTRVHINYKNSADIGNLSDDEEDVIYRVIQESITNSIRHGRATEINISIVGEHGNIIIDISDNGIGCKKIKNGFGLSHMKERLDMLGGSLSVDGSEGFKVKAVLPLRLK